MTFRLFSILSFLALCLLAPFQPLWAECTGAADCHACSSCRSCRHCAKEGGTCGVKDHLENGWPANTPAPGLSHFAPSTTTKPQPAVPPPVQNIRPAEYQTALLSLCDPAKLATLGDRGANPRLKKIVYWLDYARKAGRDPSQLVDEILKSSGYRPGHSALIKTNLLRNIKIGDELGFFIPANLERLRRGNAPIVMIGPYAGDTAEVDHIIPFSVAPQIGNDLANLELLPKTLNRRKSAKIGLRQKALARDLHEAGVIDEGLLARILNVRGSD